MRDYIYLHTAGNKATPPIAFDFTPQPSGGGTVTLALPDPQWNTTPHARPSDGVPAIITTLRLSPHGVWDQARTVFQHNYVMSAGHVSHITFSLRVLNYENPYHPASWQLFTLAQRVRENNPTLFSAQDFDPRDQSAAESADAVTAKPDAMLRALEPFVMLMEEAMNLNLLNHHAARIVPCPAHQVIGHAAEFSAPQHWPYWYIDEAGNKSAYAGFAKAASQITDRINLTQFALLLTGQQPLDAQEITRRFKRAGTRNHLLP